MVAFKDTDPTDSGRRKLPRMDMYWQDFFGDPRVMMMTPEQEWAYLRLIGISWLTGPLPSDPKALRALLKNVSAAKFKRIWIQVGECFSQTSDGKLIQKRVESERKKALEKIEKARAAGQASAEKRASAANPPPKGEIKSGQRTLNGRSTDVGSKLQRNGNPPTANSQQLIEEEEASSSNPLRQVHREATGDSSWCRSTEVAEFDRKSAALVKRVGLDVASDKLRRWAEVQVELGATTHVGDFFQQARPSKPDPVVDDSYSPVSTAACEICGDRPTTYRFEARADLCGRSECHSKALTPTQNGTAS